MKKVAVFLIACFILLTASGSASTYDYEPTVFEVLVAILTSDSFQEIIGTPKLYESYQDNDICWIHFFGHQGTIEINGFDITGTPHCLFWSGLPEINVLYACSEICQVWPELEDIAEFYGNGLAFNVTYGEEGRYIFTEEDAAEFVEWFSN